MRGPLTLVWRLERGGLGWWALGIALTVSGLSAMGSSVVHLARQGELHGGGLATMLAQGDPGVAYLRYLGVIAALLASVQVVLAVQHVRADERAGRLELIRSTGTAPWRTLAASWLVTVLAAGANLALAAVAVDLAGRTDLAVGVGAVWRELLGQWPAVVLVAGWSAFLVGRWPRGGLLAWLPVLAGAVAAQLGHVLDLPSVVLDNGLYAQAGSRAGFGLVGIGLVMAALGAARMDRRELAP